MASSAPSRRQFAALRDGPAIELHAPKLQGIIFDVDGTLWWVLTQAIQHCLS